MIFIFGIIGGSSVLFPYSRACFRINSYRVKAFNIEKWGTDLKHNVLYITGYSGSGKSTMANSLANHNVNVIHLDGYTETHLTEYELSEIRDVEFDEFLKQNFREYNLFCTSLKGQNAAKWRLMDEFAEQTERFAELQFGKGKKVIVEGIQLSDATLYPTKSFFFDKPIVIMRTNMVTSFFRARKRDGIFVKSIQSAIEYFKWYLEMCKNLRYLLRIVCSKHDFTNPTHSGGCL